MTDSESQELAKGAKGLPEQERMRLRERIPPASLKARQGFVEGVQACRALLDGAGDRLAGLAAVAAMDLLDFRKEFDKHSASMGDAAEREAVERHMEDILSGKVRGIPFDDFVREMGEVARPTGSPLTERQAG